MNKKYKIRFNKPMVFGWFKSASKRFKKLMANRSARREKVEI